MKRKSIVKTLGKVGCLALFTLTSASLLAEDVFITGWKGLTANATDHTPAPSSVIDTGFPASGAGNASASKVSPTPIIPNSDRRIHYGRVAGATWTLTPTDVSVTPVSPVGKGPYQFTALQNIGVYKLYLTKGQDNNASLDIIIQMSATGGQLADTNGVANNAILLDMYQKGKPNNVWVHVGYLTNTVLSPTITLQHVSGEINDLDGANNNAKRWYTDAIRFEYLDQCVGVATQVDVSGPLVQGQQFVNVSGVVAGATNVNVYANNSLIGTTNSVTGFTAGALTVRTTSALIKGSSITANQAKNGCIGSIPASGPIVGSGPNASLTASLSLWKNAAFTGPVGTNTSSGFTVNYFLKAAGFIGGFGTAPVGGADVPTSDCWQTITFDHSTDASVGANGTPVGQNTDPFCALDGLLFSIAEDESGPYELYVDQISNGDVVIENFEGLAAGSSRLFAAPNAAGSPSPASTYVSAPNFSMVSTNNGFDGTNSLRVQWQWVDGNQTRWARVPANMTNSSKFFTQLDPNKPITVRYLLLPAGSTTNKLRFPTVPVNQTKSVGTSATFTVGATGDAPITYQWQFAGTDIPGATTSSYTKSNLQVTDSGSYTVVVTGGTGCTATHQATLTVSDVIAPPTLSYSIGAGKITFTWSGSFTLQSKTSLSTGSWNDVTSTSGYQENLNSSTTKFFQLRQ